MMRAGAGGRGVTGRTQKSTVVIVLLVGGGLRHRVTPACVTCSITEFSRHQHIHAVAVAAQLYTIPTRKHRK